MEARWEISTTTKMLLGSEIYRSLNKNTKLHLQQGSETENGYERKKERKKEITSHPTSHTLPLIPHPHPPHHHPHNPIIISYSPPTPKINDFKSTQTSRLPRISINRRYNCSANFSAHETLHPAIPTSRLPITIANRKMHSFPITPSSRRLIKGSIYLSIYDKIAPSIGPKKERGGKNTLKQVSRAYQYNSKSSLPIPITIPSPPTEQQTVRPRILSYQLSPLPPSPFQTTQEYQFSSSKSHLFPRQIHSDSTCMHDSIDD